MKENIQAMGQDAIAKAQTEFLSKVYAWMFGGLLITGITAWYVFSSNLYIQIISNGLMWPLLIGELALVFILSARIETNLPFKSKIFKETFLDLSRTKEISVELENGFGKIEKSKSLLAVPK